MIVIFCFVLSQLLHGLMAMVSIAAAFTVFAFIVFVLIAALLGACISGLCSLREVISAE